MPARWGRISVSSTETKLSAYGCTFTFLALYVAANVLLFVRSARIEWELNTEYRKYLVPVARGCGQVVNLNLAILLTFASRLLTNFLRETTASIILPLDRILPVYHSYAGVIVFAAAAVHGIAQSAVYVISSPWSSGLSGMTSVFITGICLFAALLIIAVSALHALRERHFEIFYIMHLSGSAITAVLFILHGANHGKFTSWKWIIGPLSLYVIDRVMRKLRIRRSYLLVAKHSAGFHGPNVVKIRLPRLFHFEAGQYAELRVPEISRWQWHPFTMASAPHEEEMVFYVKVAGNWTNELYNIFCSRNTSESPGDVEVHVRGPFGAPAQHVGEYDHVILIGAGVGATPFCSVTKSAQYLLENWRPAVPRNASRTRRRPRKQSSESRSLCAVNGSPAHETTSVDIEEAIPIETEAESSSQIRQRREVHTDAPVLNSNSGEPYQTNSNSISTDNQTMYTARDGNTVSLSLRSDVVLPGPPSSIRGAIPRDYGRLSDVRNGRESRESAGRQHRPSLRFSDSNEALPSPHTDMVSRHEVNASVTSRGQSIEHREALHSKYSEQQISDTYHTSLNMLVGMNFGSVSLVKSAQFRQACADSKRIPPDVNSPERAAGISVFRSPTLMFLLFMRSATMNLVILWVIIARLLNLGVAVALGRISIIQPGLSLYNSRTLVIIDLGLSVMLCVLMIVPLVVEVVQVGMLARYGIEGLIMTPIVLLGAICDVLALCNVGQEVEVLKAMQVFTLWPFITAIVLSRLVRVIRERISDGNTGNRFKDIFTTKSLEFFWTSPTALDDAWLLHELRECGNSSVVRLHRYLTRESETDNVPLDTSESACEEAITRFGRPDWSQVFNEAACSARNGTVIGVFFCGPVEMSEKVQKAATQAMRDSVIRGLQTGACTNAFRELEEVFGDAVTTNDMPVDDRPPGMRALHGSNIRFVYRKEKFS